MIAGILKLLAKEGYRQFPKGTKRLPALVELALGTTGRYSKRKIDPTEFVEVPNYVYDNTLKKMVKQGTKKYYPDKKWSYFMHQPKRKQTKELWRGETLYPDKQYVSKAGLEHAEPGSWYSPDVLESMSYVIRPWKGGMGTDITNPGILRRIKTSDIKKRNPKFNVEEGEILDHINLPPDLRELSHISLIPTLMARLRRGGFSEARILSTIKQILAKKKPSGAADWKFYKRGGIASL
mgnify:CR=1 FL=1|tara:strand:- start:26 stop:736 length:711 start_codon:yes stop_codon:yes gene_type:complete